MRPDSRHGGGSGNCWERSSATRADGLAKTHPELGWVIGDRGKMPGPVYIPPSIFRYPRGRHSAKPREKNRANECERIGAIPLRKLRRDYPRDAHVFVSERGGPISPIGFHRLIQRLGEAANMPFPIHPHMLRHACGFKLANDGHDTRALQRYLGHKNIQHTVRYTEMAPDRFKDFWRD